MDVIKIINNIVNFLSENLVPKDFITISISVVALVFSALNFLKDRKHVNLQIIKRKPLKRVETYDMVQAYPGQTAGIGIEFRFLNTSKYNVGYFDLVFRDGYTKDILPCFYLNALRPELQNQQLLGITQDDEVINLNPKQSNYGSIPSNSFEIFGTVVHPKSNKIQVTIKFAKKFIIPNFYSETTKFAKWKKVTLTLNQDEINFINSYNQSLIKEYNEMHKDNTDIEIVQE